MKASFICILLLASFPAFCQQIPKNFLDSVLSKYYWEPANPRSLTDLEISRQRSWTRIDSTKYGIVYALPQDHMPCIVPDMKLLKAMPNAGSKSILTHPIDPGIYANPIISYTVKTPFRKGSFHFKSR